MRTGPVEHKFGKPKPYPITFGYHNILKTQYLKGNLKDVKYGIYGDKLTKKTVSLEHIVPKSKGGKTELSNLALASKRMNHARSNKPIKDFLTAENLTRYIEQFMNIKIPEFDGVKYVKELLKSINKALDLE
jgi:hypothetical protein